MVCRQLGFERAIAAFSNGYLGLELDLYILMKSHDLELNRDWTSVTQLRWMSTILFIVKMLESAVMVEGCTQWCMAMEH